MSFDVVYFGLIETPYFYKQPEGVAFMFFVSSPSYLQCSEFMY